MRRMPLLIGPKSAVVLPTGPTGEQARPTFNCGLTLTRVGLIKKAANG
jgi:hypothetical protein